MRCILKWNFNCFCISNLTITGSENALSPDRLKAIFWTIAGILLIGPEGTNFREILIKINIFSFTKKLFKVSSPKWLPLCHSLNELNSFTPIHQFTPNISRDNISDKSQPLCYLIVTQGSMESHQFMVLLQYLTPKQQTDYNYFFQCVILDTRDVHCEYNIFAWLLGSTMSYWCPRGSAPGYQTSVITYTAD